MLKRFITYYKPHKKMPNKLSKAIEMARAELLVEKVADENTPLPPLPDSLPRVFRFFLVMYRFKMLR